MSRDGGMLASLRVYNYRLYFVGQGISVAGTWMQNVAVSWAVLRLTDSALVLGVVWAARYLPIILLGPWGGLVTDRSNVRRLMVLTQALSAVLSLALALLSLFGRVSVAAVLLLVLLLGLVNVFDGPSRQSLISTLVPRDRLANAIALNSISMNTARIVGPSIAGALIATLGVTPCFFANAVSFGAVVVSVLAMRGSELVPAEREVRSKGQIRAGLRYIAGTPSLSAPLVMVLVTGMLTYEFPVSLPLVTTSTFHASATAYGIAVSCLGGGSILGAAVAARRRGVTVRSLSLSATIWGALVLASALAPTLPVLYVLVAFVGAGAVTFNSAAKTLLQLESASRMRGRVMAVWSMLWQGSTVAGAPIVGAAASFFGARYGLVVGGAGALAVGSFYLASGRGAGAGAAAGATVAPEPTEP